MGDLGDREFLPPAYQKDLHITNLRYAHWAIFSKRGLFSREKETHIMATSGSFQWILWVLCMLVIEPTS